MSIPEKPVIDTDRLPGYETIHETLPPALPDHLRRLRPVLRPRPPAQESARRGLAADRLDRHHHSLPPPARERPQDLGRSRAVRKSVAHRRERHSDHHL